MNDLILGGVYDLFLRMVFQIWAGVGEAPVRFFRVSWVCLMLMADVLPVLAFVGRLAWRTSFKAKAWVRVTSFSPFGQWGICREGVGIVVRGVGP